MACKCAFHLIFLFVGRCCWGQDNFQVARSLGLLLCLKCFAFLWCADFVRGWIAGCLIFKWSLSILVVFGCWDCICLPNYCVTWFTWFTWLGLALARFLDDCSAGCVVGSRVLELLWLSGWLFATLVCFITRRAATACSSAEEWLVEQALDSYCRRVLPAQRERQSTQPGTFIE